MITDNVMPREDMQRLLDRGCRCRCGGTLSIAWGGAFGYQGYILRCGLDVTHTDFERPHELSFGNDPDLPGWKLSKNRRQQLEKLVGAENKQALMKYEGVVSLSKEQAREIIITLWPNAEKASAMEVYKAIAICHQYGLNPLMGHLHLIPFDKKDKSGKVIATTYVVVKGIGANRLIAHRKHAFSYIDNTPRYMTEDEEKRVWKTVDPEKVRYIVTLKDVGTGATASGYGQWSKYRTWQNPQTKEVKKYPNDPKGIDKGNSMENMASIRAERQALDRLYPADMPTGIPFEDEYFEKFPDTRTQKIDTQTGEIIEGQFTEQTTETEGDESGAEPLLDEKPEGDEKAAEQGLKEPGAGGSETDLSSQKGKKQKTRGTLTEPAEPPREVDIRMARGAASKMKWDNDRLMKELKDRTKYTGFDDIPPEELHDFASKLVDMADCA